MVKCALYWIWRRIWVWIYWIWTLFWKNTIWFPIFHLFISAFIPADKKRKSKITSIAFLTLLWNLGLVSMKIHYFNSKIMDISKYARDLRLKCIFSKTKYVSLLCNFLAFSIFLSNLESFLFDISNKTNFEIVNLTFVR